jgi:uncharacterized LabA/DUF88 family protein
MIDNKNYAVFVDLENAGGKPSTISSILEKVKIRGDILMSKVYGYSEEYSGLKELLLSNTCMVVPSLRYGRNQKNNLDIQLVIDALEVAYTNPLIDCFCIVSGDSDYTPLVGKLKTMGKYVLGISRSECASRIFINACNEFQFLETVEVKEKRKDLQEQGDDDLETIASEIERIIQEQGDDDGLVYASALKNTLMRLRPDFSEKNYGCTSFGKMLYLIQNQLGSIEVTEKGKILRVGKVSKRQKYSLNSENFEEASKEILNTLKKNGFHRVNPSIIKQTLLEHYPDFIERDLGFKRFSDVLRLLESKGLLGIEFDDSRCMIVHIK